MNKPYSGPGEAPGAKANACKPRSKDFLEERHEVEEFSKETEKIIKEFGVDIDGMNLHAWKDHFQQFELVVMGMYNAGKSTLLNLLLNLDLDDGLPTGYRPTTNRLWKISYAPRPQLRAKCFGSSDACLTIKKENLSDILVALEGGSASLKTGSVDYYELGLPSDWLKRTGWTVWDTPGKDDLEGLLKEDQYDRILRFSEGAIVVTNYDQHKSCSEYLLQLKDKHIDCVVVALTNSAARSPDEFSEVAELHLSKVTNFLHDFFPAARFHFAIDSKDPSGSVDPMRNRWLESCWCVASAIEEVEEPLILLRAWRSLESIVEAAIRSMELEAACLQQEISGAEDRLNELRGLIERPIHADGLDDLEAMVAALLAERIQKKAENFRYSVEEEMKRVS